jgi:hypothetical protein
MVRSERARSEMSNVTNVLILAWGEHDAMAALTTRDGREHAAWRGYFGSLSRDEARDLWGHDGKWPECDVWAGAFNHLNRPALLAELQGLPWRDPASVQVLINGQDDDCWGLWMFLFGRLVEVDLPGATRLPSTANVREQDHFVDADVGFLVRRPPPTPTSVPCRVEVYAAEGAWHYALFADDLTTAVTGTLPVTGDAQVERAQAAADAVVRERFGAGYDIDWAAEADDVRWAGTIRPRTG